MEFSFSFKPAILFLFIVFVRSGVFDFVFVFVRFFPQINYLHPQTQDFKGGMIAVQKNIVPLQLKKLFNPRYKGLKKL